MIDVLTPSHIARSGDCVKMHQRRFYDVSTRHSFVNTLISDLHCNIAFNEKVDLNVNCCKLGWEKYISDLAVCHLSEQSGAGENCENVKRSNVTLKRNNAVWRPRD